MANLNTKTLAVGVLDILSVDGGISGNKEIKDGDGTGTKVWLDGTNLSLTATSKLYLDGGTHTYIVESGTDVMDFYVGGSNILKLDEENDKVEILGSDLEVDTTKKIYFDGGGDTYIVETSTDKLEIFAGGQAMMTFNEERGLGPAIEIGTDGNGHDFYWYGETAGDLMWWNETDNKLTINGTNGTTALNVGDGNVVFDDDLAVNGVSNLDNTDIDGTFTMDGSAFDVNATTSCEIDNSNTTNGVKIGTNTSAMRVTIGHTDSEVTIGDYLFVTDLLTVQGPTVFKRPTVQNLSNDEAIVTTTATYLYVDANGSARTGIRFDIAGYPGQLIIVHNSGGEKLTFHPTEGTCRVKGMTTSLDTMLAGGVYMFVSDGVLWNLIGGGSLPNEGLTAT